MEAVNGELETKYQKIAAEYSKIRAQAKILKTAVIEEQTRNADIREQLKEKEVELRRAEQELDSLSFRNQQLTKRITVLQEELDKIQTKPKQKRNKSSTENKTQQPHSQNHILDEEFQKKIIENAQLLSHIADKDNEIDALREEIKFFENKLTHCEKTKLTLDTHYREIIDKFERERDELQRKLSEKQKQEETVSWSSGEGKREGCDYDLRIGIINHRQNDHSPLSSPSASRRSSKSTLEMGPRKQWLSTQEDNSDDYDFTKPLELEKELNHWKAQYNILKLKYDEIVVKESLETHMADNVSLEPIEINNMIGRLTTPFAVPEEIEAREAKIREYFLREIDKLVTEKHLCHVKNLAIATNNEVTNVHLDTSEAKREKCETELKETLSSWNRLQEDKEAQEGNYKLQLSTMSEHLANMNEKLIQQTEEIQQLKFELWNKNTKRGK